MIRNIIMVLLTCALLAGLGGVIDRLDETNRLLMKIHYVLQTGRW